MKKEVIYIYEVGFYIYIYIYMKKLGSFSPLLNSYLQPLNLPEPHFVCKLLVARCVQLFTTQWTVARQSPLSVGFSS